ncbi:MAG: hypothetical protein OXR73_10685 [Myxococcales bacterium]|nr:hypothetical protein [Myxococcales bacterium]
MRSFKVPLHGGQAEEGLRRGVIDALALQQGFGSVLATTAHAHASGFRQLQLSRSPWLGDA